MLNFYDYSLFHKVALVVGKSAALADESVQRIGQVIEGLSLERCARDCNLQQSNCLAFDVCEFETGVTVCTLFTIRSPLAPKTRLLPDEQRFYGSEASRNSASDGGGFSAMLVENRQCAHFYLKESYLGLKVNHLLDSSPLIKRQKLDELEKKMLKFDTTMGDLMLLRSALGFHNTTNDGDNNNNNGNQRRQVSAIGGGGLVIHLVLIVSSAILAALAYLYGADVCTFALDQVEAIRARRARRFGEHRISQLQLPVHDQGDL